jgi:hypothetical protein
VYVGPALRYSSPMVEREADAWPSVESGPVVTVHLVLAVVATAASLVVIASAIWSAAAGRRSGGRRDHRSAVDRAVLVVLGSALAAGLVGVVLFGTGSQPADPLHFLYGPAAVIALPVAIWVGARGAPGGSSRVRRDVWTAGGGLVLLGIVLRLFATG